MTHADARAKRAVILAVAVAVALVAVVGPSVPLGSWGNGDEVGTPEESSSPTLVEELVEDMEPPSVGGTVPIYS